MKICQKFVSECHQKFAIVSSRVKVDVGNGDVPGGRRDATQETNAGKTTKLIAEFFTYHVSQKVTKDSTDITRSLLKKRRKLVIYREARCLPFAKFSKNEWRAPQHRSTTTLAS
jgi:hypothetical protein